MRLSVVIFMFCLSLSVLASWDSLQAPRLNEVGIPQGQRYLVGGGQVFDYTAQEPGVLILVNKANNTPVLTKSLNAGENFKAIADTFEHSEAEESPESDRRKSVYVLYFVPST